jgi:hypothetical protein
VGGLSEGVVPPVGGLSEGVEREGEVDGQMVEAVREGEVDGQVVGAVREVVAVLPEKESWRTLWVVDLLWSWSTCSLHPVMIERILGCLI